MTTATTARCRACPEPLDAMLIDNPEGRTGLHIGCVEPVPVPVALAASVATYARAICPDGLTCGCAACDDPADPACLFGGQRNPGPHQRVAPAAPVQAAPPSTFAAPAGPAGSHPLKTELIDIIRWADADTPRSRQTSIGPSELGVDCMRRLAYRFTGTQAVNTTADPWFAIVGTSVHTWLAVATDNYNAKVLDRIHYLSEQRITATAGGFSCSGSCDLYRGGSVIDYKIMGSTSLKKIRDKGPSNQYRVQVHTYGLGHQQAGREVTEVALACLPRNGYLTDAYVWTERFQPQVAVDALTRAASIKQLATVLPPAMLPASPDPAACAWCPFYRPGSPADATGCPGPEVVP